MSGSYSFCLRRALILSLGLAGCAPGGEKPAPDTSSIRPGEPAPSPSPADSSSGILIFSTLAWNDEAGEPYGHELTLRKLGQSWVATYTFAEGRSGPCDTLAVSGDLPQFRLTLPPTIESGVELHPAWPVDGFIQGDTLRAIVHKRWPAGKTEVDTLYLPRVTATSDRDCGNRPSSAARLMAFVRNA
jgi:hypothetical protein